MSVIEVFKFPFRVACFFGLLIITPLFILIAMFESSDLIDWWINIKEVMCYGFRDFVLWED